MDGGPTSLDNLVLLCRRHHRLVHEGGLGLQRATDGTVSWQWPDGRPLSVAPPQSPISADDPLAPITARLTAQRITIMPRALPVWEGGAFNLVYALDALYRRPAACGTAPEP
jgi:hypothetical protein